VRYDGQTIRLSLITEEEIAESHQDLAVLKIWLQTLGNPGFLSNFIPQTDIGFSGISDLQIRLSPIAEKQERTYILDIVRILI
jgi:hypothetical protein